MCHNTERLSYVVSYKPCPEKKGLLVQGTGKISNLPETRPGSKPVVPWPFLF